MPQALILQGLRHCLVEANREKFMGCSLTQLADLKEVEPDRLPVILKERPATLTSTYYVGKQTLKDNYFGQAPVVMN